MRVRRLKGDGATERKSSSPAWSAAFQTKIQSGARRRHEGHTGFLWRDEMANPMLYRVEIIYQTK